MYQARRNFLLKGEKVRIGDPVNLSGLTRPEALVRGGFVAWIGEGARDKIHPEAFREDFYGKPAKKAARKTTAKKAVATVQPLRLGKKVAS
jgi:hypothetical protein